MQWGDHLVKPQFCKGIMLIKGVHEGSLVAKEMKQLEREGCIASGFSLAEEDWSTDVT